MLIHLHVKNLALIEEAEVDFGEGLNILTGETGAGKSILIGSVNLALGQKLSRDMIREGESSALAELVFQVNKSTEEKLKELDVYPEDGQVIITRKISENRSICKVNGETCTAAAIRRIAELLLDIHGQHEHQSLLYPDRQMEILDKFGSSEIEPVKEETANLYRSYRQVKKELEAYEIGGYHYFKLRDLGTALHFQVGFDEASRSVQIDSETASDAPEQPAAASDAEAVWTQVNAAREAAGLDPLALDDALCEAAQVRAEELAQVFDHTRPNGESCFTVLDEVDVGDYHTAGENIAMGYGDADSVMDGWMNSPGHRANILNEDFSRIGVAHAGQGWVQLFLG